MSQGDDIVMKYLLYGLVFLVVITVNITAQAQIQTNAVPEEFIEHIDGNDDPSLISESTLFRSLSKLLIDTGPSKCINDIGNTNRGFSSGGPCMVLDGVDPSQSEILAMDYIQYDEGNNLIELQEVCSIKTSLDSTKLTTEEFNNHHQTILENLDIQRAEYFKTKGSELLGSESMTILLKWANDNIRPGIHVMKIDKIGLMVSSGGTIDQVLALICRE